MVPRGVSHGCEQAIRQAHAKPDARNVLWRARCSVDDLTPCDAGPVRVAQLRRVADEVKVCGATEINFLEALRWLRAKWNVRRLLCEGGGELNAALLQAGLVNELHLTICPKIFGGRTAPTLADGSDGLALEHATRLKLKSAQRHDDELFLIYQVI